MKIMIFFIGVTRKLRYEVARKRYSEQLPRQPHNYYTNSIPTAKSEEQLACEKEWLQAGQMWLAHRGGFTAVRREADAEAGRVRVRVIASDEIVTVDEDDLEKANPPQLERCEDIASLRCLNECGALHVLRARHAAGLAHARAGHALLVLGPPRSSAPVYTDKVAAMFRGCRADDMPPHIFASAQTAHRCMLATRRDRAIVFLGRNRHRSQSTRSLVYDEGYGILKKIEVVRHIRSKGTASLKIEMCRLFLNIAGDRETENTDVVFGHLRRRTSFTQINQITVTTVEQTGYKQWKGMDFYHERPTRKSGSGKTSAMRLCAWYLASAYPAAGSKLTPEKFDAAFDALYSFGSCRSGSNSHASRFVSLTSLDFDGGGALVSASIQTLLPDLRPAAGHFRALHNLVHGCDGRLRRELLLDQAPINVPNPFVGNGEKADAPTEFSSLKEALKTLGVTELEQMSIWKILAAVCHLGWAGTTKSPPGCAVRHQFASTACGERAARLLGVAGEQLTRALFSAPAPPSPQAHPNRPSYRTPSPSNEKELTGAEALDAFITGLYNEAFNMIAALVNRSLSTSARTTASILLLDSPGADNPMCAGQQSGASLSKLLSNYLQERLQAVFHDAMLVAPRERYAQEGITLADDGGEEDWLSETVNPGPMIDLLDKAPQNTIVRSSQTDLRECDRRGLLWLLDEESMYPGSSDDTFLERVMAHYGPPHHTQYLIKKAPHVRQFVLQHLQGYQPRSIRRDRVGESQPGESMKKHPASRRGPAAHAGWAPGALRSVTRPRCAAPPPYGGRSPPARTGMKRRSTALQAKFVADGIVDTLRRCGAGGLQFVCCLLMSQAHDDSGDVNVPLLRSQFRGFQLLDAARLYKQGFPEHMPLAEFARRYRLLAYSGDTGKEEPTGAPLSERQLVDDMLLALDLDVTSYRLGLTQVSVCDYRYYLHDRVLY
ncbi:Unconventional myosin-XVIIIa [Eumeta japonica]|uniref:Unconventional myosin-XVIIIa n=1 Tax=Eumeta variegata TaxID=151549 RepID=A0A4C1SEM8_EUMVA|nr:Unconventional myosin-XVIIIa [Eumeta japonica]